MCGRFSLTLRSEDIQSMLTDIFGTELIHKLSNHQPRYNMAPSQEVWSIVFDGMHFRLGKLSWGFIPSFATDKKIAFQMINAKTESIFEKPSFSTSIFTSRCLILATGFYEWQDHMGTKIPHHIAFKDQALFAFAGVYAKNSRIESKSIFSTAILTHASEGIMETIHSRSPVMLQPSLWKTYLKPELKKQDIQSFFIAIPDNHLAFKQVSTYINKPSHEGPQCLQPYESSSLF